MAPTKHSKLGASNAERWLNCHGSVAACAALPKPPESSYAREGTAAHKLAEICLLGDLQPNDFVSRFIELEDGTKYEVTPEMGDAVTVYTDAVRAVLAEGYSFFAVEQKLTLTDFDLDLGIRTSDCTIITLDGTLHQFDLKYGAGVAVVVEHNPQLMNYALAALMACGGGVSRVVLHVVQPRCEHAGEPHRTWECDPMELIEFGYELANAAGETRKPNAPLKAGPWCKKTFCPAAATCPALYSGALAAAGAEFDDITAPLIEPSALTPDELGRRLAMLDVLDVWAKAFRAFCFSEAKAGRPPTGMKLVAKRGRRQWRSPLAAMHEAQGNFANVTRDDLFEMKPISPAQFEKLVGKAASKSFLRDHAEMKSSGITLVSLSDKREAVTHDALSEFEAIEEYDGEDT